MRIWTYKPVVFLVTAALASCSDAVPGASDGLAQPVTSARFLEDIAIKAPDGFCFDSTSLTSHFALLARCDVLGMRGAFEDTPLAIITMTLAEGDDLDLTGSLTVEDEKILADEQRGALKLVKIDGASPSEALSGLHWRGVGQIGEDKALGLAIYPSADLSFDDSWAGLLEQAYERSSADLGSESPFEEGAVRPKETGPTWLAGLLNRNNSIP